MPRATRPLDEVKYHAFSIKRIFDRLANLATGDNSMALKAAQMMGETAYNVVRMIGDAAKKLLPSPPEAHSIRVEVREDLDECSADSELTASV